MADDDKKGAPAPGTPTADDKGGAPPEPTKGEPPAGAKPDDKVTPPAKAEPPKGDDDDQDPTPDEKGIIALPQKSFLKRVAQMSAKELKRIFGTSDVDKIAAERKEYLDLKKGKEEADKKAEEERRAKLKEEERLKEDLKKKEEENEQLRQQTEAEKEERMADRQDTYLTGVAEKLFEADSVDYALSKFKKHLRDLSTSKVEKMTEGDVKEWFEDFAKKNPKHAKETEEAKAAREKAEKEEADKGKRRVPLDTKPKTVPKRPGTIETGKFAGKTVRPGQPNSMTAAEFAEYKKQHGISY